MAKSFYIIDGHAQIYRAFYAPFRDLTSPTGEPTKAVHVFCQMLFNLIRQRRPDYVAMTMDVDDHSVFRCRIDPEYKAHRDPAPEALHTQADRIVAIVSAMGLPVYRLSGFEADDLMATMAERLRDQDLDVYFVSKDKDLDQLITDKVRLYDPQKDEVVDAASMQAAKGYGPHHALEVQTLVGDSTDNIPGVHGVGPKTAAKLVQQYGSAAAVVEHADELTPKLREQVKAFAAQMPITRQLVTLRRDVPLTFELGDCAIDRLNPRAVLPIFDELGFRTLKEALIGLAPGGVVDVDGGVVSPPPRSVESRQTGTEAGSYTYHLIDSPETFEAFLADLSKQRIFALDTETTGLNPLDADLVGLSFCWKSGEAYYLPVRSCAGAALPPDVVLPRLRPVLENPSVAKVGQNIKYDLLVLRRAGVRVTGVAFDTMIASMLLDPERSSHSIDALAKTLTGHDMIPITDLIGKGKDQITMDQVDTRRVCEYAAEDADYTWRILKILEPRIKGSHVEALFRDTEMPLLDVLVEMEHHGVALDPAPLKKLGGIMADRMLELTRELHKAAGHSFNVDSTKQLANVLFDEQGLQVVRKTKTGRSTDAETLEALAEQSDNPIPKLVLEYRELAKLKSTYVDTLPTMVSRRTGRIHATFKQTGAVTGRLSSSDPNLQNIPIRTPTGRQIRAAFVAGSADSVLLIADYSQVELRLLAHFCGDENLMAAFRAGRDIHRAVAAEVQGVPLDAVTSEQRGAAKAVNFGIIYGQSPFGLSKALGIPVHEARRFIDTYFARYPGIRRFIDECVANARRTGYAETILGRRRPIPELQSRNRAQMNFGERIAVNTVVQGSAADLIKRAMIDIHREIMEQSRSAKMLIQVHDELVFEVPERDVEREAELIRARMEGAIPLRVPITVDVAWGRTWAEGK